MNEAGKQTDGMEFGLYERLARSGNLVMSVDVRGIGETRPPHESSSSRINEFSHLFDVETAMAYMTWFMDESLFGMRVQDVVRSVDYLLSRPDVAKDRLENRRQGSGRAVGTVRGCARFAHSGCTCERGLISYASLARTDRYLHNASIFVRDVLKHFDLPQVAAMVANRRLTLVSPVDAMKQRVDPAAASSVYKETLAAYQAAGADGRFTIA